MSCASCHDPYKGWSDERETAKGSTGKILMRKTPTVAYLERSQIFFWDGRVSSLEEQALIPIQSPDEMNQILDQLIDELNSVPDYISLFDQVFPKEGITERTIAHALASFEKSLTKRDSPFDRWNSGQANAISEDAKKGYSVFSSLKTNCLFCHKGVDFTDGRLWDTGIDGPDSGRHGLFAFKTPTLRDVALRAPFFHNGKTKTLEDVVRFYARGGDVHRPTQASSQRREIELSENEIFQIVEFLKTLTTDNSKFKLPTLPK